MAREWTPEELVEEMPCGYVVLGVDGAVLFANRAFKALVGWNERDGPRRFQDFLSPGGNLFFETQFKPSLMLRGSLQEIALDLLSPSAGQTAVLVNAKARRDGTGAVTGFLLATFAANDRRRYERELLKARKEAEQTSEVVRRSSDAILRLSPEAVIQSWNEGAQQIFGFRASEALGCYFPALLFPGEAEGELRAAIEFLKNGTRTDRELQARRKTGEVIQVSVSLTAHLEPPGTLVAISAIVRDITARKIAERAVLVNEKLASVGRLASSIAHEINNPLESVTNLLYLLRAHVTDAEGRRLVEHAENELARVSHIATHTLRFHRQATQRTWIDVGALVESVMSLYAGRLKGSGIRSTVDCSRASELFGFDGELRQVLVNLVSNSFDAMRSGGHLIIRSRDIRDVESGEPGLRIIVADDGSGMPASTLEHIFEPFYSTKGIGGTGLGMWISQDLVRKNGGKIRIRSSTHPKHHGTVVVLDFFGCCGAAGSSVQPGVTSVA